MGEPLAGRHQEKGPEWGRTLIGIIESTCVNLSFNLLLRGSLSINCCHNNNEKKALIIHIYPTRMSESHLQKLKTIQTEKEPTVCSNV